MIINSETIAEGAIYAIPLQSCRAKDLDIKGQAFGVRIEKRPKGQSDLIHLYVEDDEIYHLKQSFAAYWLVDLEQVIKEAQTKADMTIIMQIGRGEPA